MIVYVSHTPTIYNCFKHFSYNKLTILTANKAVINFCNIVNISYIEIPQSINKSYNDLKIHKKTIDSICKNISQEKIYFEHQAHDYWGLYLIHVLSTNNTVYYDDPLNIEHKFCSFFKAMISSKKSRRILLDCLILGSITKMKFDVIFDGNGFTIGLKKSKLKKLYSPLHLIHDEIIFSANQAQVFSAYKISKPEIIFADQGEIIFSIPEAVVDVILEIAKTHTVLLKEHPRIPSVNHKLVNQLKRIPIEIPLEMLITKETVIIGITSTFLKFFKSISIINLVDFNENYSKSNYYNYIKSETVIIPNTINELENNINFLLNLNKN